MALFGVRFPKNSVKKMFTHAAWHKTNLEALPSNLDPMPNQDLAETLELLKWQSLLW